MSSIFSLSLSPLESGVHFSSKNLDLQFNQMENLLGLLRIHVQKGVNLAIRDARSSDPYVIVRMGKQVTTITTLPNYYSSSFSCLITFSCLILQVLVDSITYLSVPIIFEFYFLSFFSGV